MTAIRQIVTHPGSAHKDDFLACSLLVHLHGVPIFRREPTREDLDDSATCVVDVGGEHEPDRRNFDHHQFPRDHEPICALSLVLQDLGLYEDGKAFCEWLEPAEWLDCLGPIETSQKLGVERDIITKLVSPIDVTLLRRFAGFNELNAPEPLWHIMQMVGEDLIGYLRSLRNRLNEIATQAEWWDITGGHAPLQALFLPRTDSLRGEASFGLGRFIEEQGKDDSVIAMVYADRRGSGYGMSRHNDDPRMDFTRITDREDVHFAHPRGFVAKTTATDTVRLRELLKLAFVE
jgi:hypothetical protein